MENETGKKRIFEGRAERQTNHADGSEWWTLEKDDGLDNCSSDVNWLVGLDDKRVRITIEVLDVAGALKHAHDLYEVPGFTLCRIVGCDYMRNRKDG